MTARSIKRWARLGAVALVGSALLAGACDKTPEGGDIGGLPETIAQEVEEGGPNAPPQPANIQNNGNCNMLFTVTTETTDGAQWLSVHPDSGTVAPGDWQRLDVSFDVLTTPPLLPGTYMGTVTVTATCEATGRPAKGSPALIAANPTVTPVFAEILVHDPNISLDGWSLQDKWTPTSTLGAPAARRTLLLFGWATRWLCGGARMPPPAPMAPHMIR